MPLVGAWAGRLDLSENIYSLLLNTLRLNEINPQASDSPYARCYNADRILCVGRIGCTYIRLTCIYPGTNSPLQEATAVGFEKAAEQDFFARQVEEYRERRAVFTAELDKVGLPYTVPDGGYFVLVQNDSIKIPDDFVFPDIVRLSCLIWHFSPVLY